MKDPYIPHSAESEKCLAGCILASDGDLLDLLPPIDLDLFHLPGVKTVVETLQVQRGNGKPCDLISITSHMNLTVHVAWRPVEGWQGLLTDLHISYGVGGQAIAEYHLSILRDQLQLRRLLVLERWLSGQIRPGVVAADLMAGINERLALAEPQADTADHALPRAVQAVLARLDAWDASGESPTLKTPINVWNTAFGGLPLGAYLALGGRPGAGKSAMVEQMVYDLIISDRPCCVFMKDMSVEMLMTRLACRAAGVPYWKVQKGFASKNERALVRECVAFFPQTTFRLHDPAGLTADMLAAIVRREKRLYGIQAVFLDHIQLLSIGTRETVDGLTRASITIKNSAHESNVPHVVLFQLNREGDKRDKSNSPVRPTAKDVKGFDQLLSDVDGMAMLWTDQDKTELKKGQRLKVNFFAPKNRGGGETEEEIWFDGPNLTFVNHPDDKLAADGTIVTAPPKFPYDP